MIDAPGIYTIPASVYHADPVAAAPSLSRSIAKQLIQASPAHAYVAHPRLGGQQQSAATSDDAMDIGSAVHSGFLDGEDIIVHVPFKTFQSNAAKEMRDDALQQGKIPLKTKDRDKALRIIEALETFRTQTGLFTKGKPEQSLIWDEGDHWARCRVDWLPDDPAAPLLDLKTTEGLATLQAWSRRCFDVGADIQASMYGRGCEFIRGEPPEGMLFVVVEQNLPHGIRVFGLDPVSLEMGAARAAAARAVWVQCMRANSWPGYARETEWVLPPPWIVRGWEESKSGGFARAVEDTAFIERMIAAGQWGG